ncbi:MAG: recombinase XerD, partial [Planctomycetes bacterium]|nr:recombinase XerD [Planctomycetota bacterium]
MPGKHSSRNPRYRLHRPSGQAVVTVCGKDHYLGKHSSKASREAYDRLIAEWLRNGRTLPVHDCEPISINELLLAYFKHAQKHYKNRRAIEERMSHIRCAMRPLKALYGGTNAADFGPKSLLTVRDRLIAGGLGRTTVNQRVQAIRRIFKWAVREELIPPSVHHGLSAVDGLKAGESDAPAPRRVLPVPDEHVDAVLPHVLPPVAAMIRLQRLTGMRPGEATDMRGADIDMTGRLWSYRPREHKMEHHGYDREIVLGKNAQRIIREFLRTDVEEFLFRPDEAERARDAERGKRRETPLWPSHVRVQKRKRKAKPKRVPRDHYCVRSYARAICRVCDANE